MAVSSLSPRCNPHRDADCGTPALFESRPGASPTSSVHIHLFFDLRSLRNTRRTVTNHDTRFADSQHKWEFMVQISPCACFVAGPQCWYITAGRVRTTRPGIHFPSCRCSHICSTTRSRAQSYFFGVHVCCRYLLPTSSQSHIVIARHSGSDTKLAVSPMYIKLLPDETSKYVFIVGICTGRHRGTDMGRGIHSASKTP